MKLSEVKEIIIHCSATVEGRDYTVADIDRWHRARGFAKVGYYHKSIIIKRKYKDYLVSCCHSALLLITIIDNNKCVA